MKMMNKMPMGMGKMPGMPGMPTGGRK
jgi:hypothetical protein